MGIMGTRFTISDTDRRIAESMYPGLRRFAAVVASYDIEPDDVVQEALVRALNGGSLQRFDNPTAYLRRTMVNLVIDHQRARARKRSRLSQLAAGREVGTTDTYPSDLDILRSLSPRARAVLYLAEVEGYGYREIGEMLDCSEPAARMTAMRARRQLRATVTVEAGRG